MSQAKTARVKKRPPPLTEVQRVLLRNHLVGALRLLKSRCLEAERMAKALIRHAANACGEASAW